MTGGSLAHQDIVFNLRTVLAMLLAGRPFRAVQQMRLQIGDRVRYPDVVIFGGPLDQGTRTLVDAMVIFEILSNDTVATDRVAKLGEYTEVPSLRAYVLLEQTAVAATLFQPEIGGPWIATAHTTGDLFLPGIDIAVYQGLTFPA
jgi:Uma2 family endonuclease